MSEHPYMSAHSFHEYTIRLAVEAYDRSIADLKATIAILWVKRARSRSMRRTLRRLVCDLRTMREYRGIFSVHARERLAQAASIYATK